MNESVKITEENVAGETSEKFKARTGRDVPRHMAVYARFRTDGRRWNSWKILPYHEAETMIGYYTDHEIILANSDYCPIGGK
jgi:hypothetical protein